MVCFACSYDRVWVFPNCRLAINTTVVHRTCSKDSGGDQEPLSVHQIGSKFAKTILNLIGSHREMRTWESRKHLLGFQIDIAIGTNSPGKGFVVGSHFFLLCFSMWHVEKTNAYLVGRSGVFVGPLYPVHLRATGGIVQVVLGRLVVQAAM